ncbi:biotin transporter BioY [uncultured Tateyamaria sp.]|uniref:biotin transporter BioY n=1 Tax=uncultured Tateyamaria sp. TaxID=455651 RepID=UPI0026272491|nr:biotin transporter BioY [uncultured Tateyamaria sp.]
MSITTAEPRALISSFPIRFALAVGLLTLSAKVTIPFYPVPMTMQVAEVLLIAGLGGLRFGAASIIGYLVAGASGMPVFAGTPEKGIGIAYMVGPTGGYLFGFLLAASLVGWAVDRFGSKSAPLVMTAGLVLIYAAGLIWLAQFVPTDKLLEFGLAPFLLGDVIKVALAAILTLIAPVTLKRWIKG